MTAPSARRMGNIDQLWEVLTKPLAILLSLLPYLLPNGQLAELLDAAASDRRTRRAGVERDDYITGFVYPRRGDLRETLIKDGDQIIPLEPPRREFARGVGDPGFIRPPFTKDQVVERKRIRFRRPIGPIHRG